MLLVNLEPAERAGLTPEQRIVQDHYEDAEKELVMIRERITSDPCDIGLCFPEGTWSRGAIRQYRESARYPPTKIIWKSARRLPEVSRKHRSPRPLILGPADQTQSVALPENDRGNS